MSEKLIRKYQVPGFGEVRLVHSTDGQYHGHYYARSHDHGIFGRFSNDETELMHQAGLFVESQLIKDQEHYRSQLAPIEESLVKMNVNSMRGQLLRDFEVKEEDETRKKSSNPVQRLK